eukprot:gene17640-21036_t
MFKLNFKIALRNILRNKVSSLINIGGLAIEQIYQAMVSVQDLKGNKSMTIPNTQNALAQAMKEEFDEVKQIARTTDLSKRLLANGTRSFKMDSRYADPAFLSIFNLNFIVGNPQKALTDPNSILLTESAAKRLFGSTDVLNKTLRFEDQVNLKVTAVVKDLPGNVSYGFEALTPWGLFENLNQWVAKAQWGNHSFFTLVRMGEKTDIDQFNEKLKDIAERHSAKVKEDVFIYPLNKLHLYGDFVNGKNSGGKITELQMFMALALGILLIACINFMNLATARSEKRAKEVGIKKTIGASKGSLIFQFLLESFLLTLMSVLLAIVIIEYSLPWFNHLLDITIHIDYSSPLAWSILVGVLVLTAILAGCYPAFYLSGFNPVQTLKKKSSNSVNSYSLNLRQALVVCQFGFAVVLLVTTVVIYKQLQFIKNRPLGYQNLGLVEMPHEGLLYPKFELFKSKLLASNAVSSVTQASAGITNKNGTTRSVEWKGMLQSDKLVDFDQIFTTYDFIKTTGMKLLAGRDFSKEFASDSAALMLNEKAVKVMGLKNPIGSNIVFQGHARIITGVFKDIVWGNRSKSEAPMIIAYDKNISDVITMRLNPAMPITESIATIGSIAKELNPAFPFDLQFVDRLNEVKLKDEAKLAILSNLFGGLSIFISCMGLFGLSAYSAEQRTKEIGIRKVLGATVQELMGLLSMSFVKLIAVAILLAFPLAYYLMKNWLQHFEFQTPLSWWIFLSIAIFTIVIAVLTVSWQAYRVAKANPVKALKYE